jgi:hypothetical protein
MPVFSRQYQRGQALTEVVLSMMLVLIPTFIIGWALYAFGQTRTTALNGARYAAWERTVWREDGDSSVAKKSTNDIREFMVERFFARPDAAITSNLISPANADIPSFYSLHNGDKVIDLERTVADAQEGKAARPTLTLNESPEKTSTMATLYNGMSSIMGKLGGGGGMELEDKGLYVAEVKLKLNAVRHLKVFEDLNLMVTQRAAVVTDNWSAGGEAHEEAVVKPMVPASKLSEMTEFFGLLEEWTPFAEFEPGCIRGDVAPKDMLPSGSAQAGGVCKK